MDDPEGATPLDLDELAGLKAKHVTTREQLDELEQVNIQDGLRWLSRQRHRNMLTNDFAVALHRRLFGNVWHWAGSYRKTGKNIGIDPVHIEVELRVLMDDARYWLHHKTFPPVEAALRLHHRLTFIHSFPNGNGRHARIMADAVLEKMYGVAPIDWTGGHDLQQIGARRSAYIASLRAADAGDYAALLEFAGIVRPKQ